MKKLIFLLLIVHCSLLIAFGQVPQSFKYQAIVRDNLGNPITSKTVYFHVSILKGSISGTVAYSEEQQAQTNQYGLVNFNIGDGTNQIQSISSIDWAGDKYFIKLQYKETFSADYQPMGTSQLESVPYSLYSEKSGTAGPTGATGPTGSIGVTGATGQTLYHNGTTWVANNNIYNDGTAVGIGTTSPWSAGASAKIIQLSATQYPQYLLQSTSANLDNKLWRLIGRDSKFFQIQTLSDAFDNEQTGLQIERNANSIVSVSFPNGNVGISTTTPAYTLDVTGTGQFTNTLKIGSYTLPSNDGTAGQVLATNGSGSLSWTTLSSGTSGGWALNGNLNTNPSTNYIGTSDLHPLVFRVNSVKSGLIDPVSYNSAFGFEALMNNNGGMYNTASGVDALYANTTGSFNSADGDGALNSNTIGTNNTANGYLALAFNIDGKWNTADGSSALKSNISGSYNTANGYYSMNGNTYGQENTAIGVQALKLNTTGSYNTAIGVNSLYSNIDGNYNTASGHKALYSNTNGWSNTAIGYSALNKNTTASDNTACGMYALELNNGDYNSALGFQALGLNTNGYNNTAIGFYAGKNNSIGHDNLFLGYSAGISNISGIGNQFIGSNAGHNSIASWNTLIGDNAGYRITSGHDNQFIGSQSGTNTTIGSYNICLGTWAGNNNISGSYNTYLGNGANSADGVNNSAAIGNVAYVEASNTIVLGSINGVNGAGATSVVAIGRTTPAYGYMLSVNGKIISEELKVQLVATWPDYVFDEKYQLMPLVELEKSIDQEKHLPGLPSAADVKNDGIMVGDMQAKLLKKVEELTLYVIKLQKQNDELAKKDKEIMQMINDNINCNY